MLLNSVWPVSWSLLFPSQEVLLKLRGDGIDERHFPKMDNPSVFNNLKKH